MKKYFLSFLLITSLLYSREPEREKSEYTYEPILAGTLLAFFPNNISPGDCLLEPYFFVGNTNGVYNSEWKTEHTIKNFESQLLLLVETGITPWLDIALTMNENYTSSHGRKSWNYGDTRLSLGFQITKNKSNSVVPDFRLLLLESFPTGNYQHLNPKKTLSDVTGSGAYETWLIAIVTKIIYFTPRQPLSINLNLGCNAPTTVHVKGFNLYGGGPIANGSVKPGQQFLGNLGLEYSLTINWILGLDIHYTHQNKSHSAHPDLGLPSSEEYSLAPCIEYNPTTHFGIEAGAWFSIAGRNAFSFATSVATIYWFF